MMQELAASNLDLDAFSSRFPRYAEAIHEAWMKAMDDVRAALRQPNPININSSI
jgi:hypothetical protein